MSPLPRKDRSPRTIPSRGRIPLLAAAVLFFAGSAHAGHPLGTEDAGTQGKGNAEVEFNGERSSGGGARETSLGNTYTLGLSPRIDLAVSFIHVRRKTGGGAESVRGMGDTEATLKTSFRNGSGWMPTIGIKGGVLLPTGDETEGLGEGRSSGLFTGIAGWEYGAVLFHANAGLTVASRPIGSRDRDDRAKASLAAEWEVGNRWFLLGEYLWEKNTGASGNASSELLAGVKMEASRNLVLDIGIRWGMTGDSPDVTYLVGITLAFRGGNPEENRLDGHQRGE